MFQCNRCKKQLSLTAGTVFQDTKLPLTAWFAAIYHLTQARTGSARSSWRGGSGCGSDGLAGQAQADAGDGRARGREAEARRPGRGRRRLPRRRALRRQAGPGRGRQDADRRRGRDHGRAQAEAAAAHGGQGLPQEGGGEAGQARLAPGSNVVSDGLSCWPAVEKAGCQHFPMATGSGKRAASWAPFKWVNTCLGNVKTAIAGTYHHVSAEACAVLPDQLRLPVQSPLPARQHRRAPRLGRRPYRAAALSGRCLGCVRRIIRYFCMPPALRGSRLGVPRPRHLRPTFLS